MLGIVFLNQGLSQVAVMKAYEVSLTAIPTWALLIAGAGLICLGFFWKAWATCLTGLDTYYYRDMFLGRSTASAGTEPYVVSGPFRFVDNPMYGVGNLQAYGGAVWFGSWQGLVVSFVFQASIYAFYFLFERPFVIRTYQQPAR
jgi:protein-S-isoprenylcysteine O-methyltransferase Ste14